MSGGLKGRLKGAARALVLNIGRKAARSRHLKLLGRTLLARTPALHHRVRALLARNEPLPPRRMHVPFDSNDLSPATQALYQELKRHFEARQS